MPILRRLIIPVVLILLVGCGGDSGSEDTSGDNNLGSNVEEPDLTYASITRENGAYIMDSVFYFTETTKNTVNNAPFAANSYFYYLGSGDYSEEKSCDNPDGTISFSSSFIADGTGEVVFTETDCETSAAGVQTNGIFRITVDGTDDLLFPNDYQVRYENYEIDSSTGTGSVLINGTITVQPVGDSQQVAYVDMKVTDQTATDRYIETETLTFDFEVPSGSYASVDGTSVSGAIITTDLGAVEVVTQISMAGNMVIYSPEGPAMTVTFIDESYINVCLDADGDMVDEAFLHAYISDLGLDHGANDDPVIDIEDTLEKELKETAVISLLDVTDPDCDFLDYSLEIISGPEGSQVDWRIPSGDELYIDADIPGDYILELTVNDGNGGTTSRQINLHNELGASDEVSGDADGNVYLFSPAYENTAKTPGSGPDN